MDIKEREYLKNLKNFEPERFTCCWNDCRNYLPVPEMIRGVCETPSKADVGCCYDPIDGASLHYLPIFEMNPHEFLEF